MAPPWEEIYTIDNLRRMSLATVEAFHDNLIQAYRALGYELVELPSLGVLDRAAFMEHHLGSSQA